MKNDIYSKKNNSNNTNFFLWLNITRPNIKFNPANKKKKKLFSLSQENITKLYNNLVRGPNDP